MSKPRNTPFLAFQSCLAPWFQRFIQEKRTLGFKYISPSFTLRQLDNLLIKKGQKTKELPRSILELWLKPQPRYTLNTLSHKCTVARQLALFLIRNGIPAYIFPAKVGQIYHSSYVPWIFSHNDIHKILAAADFLPFCAQSPLRHRIFPEVFRLLYGCGLRVSEVTHLQVQDVDLAMGVLIIREAKGNNDRLVPLACSIKERLKHYAGTMGNRLPDVPFFPAPDGTLYGSNQIYHTFRQLLQQAGISHLGRGRGPRLHDLRHTFAVHRLIKWYREGADINAKLPVLSTYLGHRLLAGTQRYLHLTAELFPDLTLNLESTVGHVIPRRSTL
jgi:site-specific recombinase XerD